MSKKLSRLLRKCVVILVMTAVLLAQAVPVSAANEDYVGICMNSLTNLTESQAIENIIATVQGGADEYEEYYDIVETTEHLKTFVSKVTEGKAGVSLFGFSFNASIMKKIEDTVEVNSNTMSLVYIVRYNGPTVTIQSGKFTQDAVNLISAGKKSDFEAQYGNSYVKNAHLGGLLIITLSVDTHNMTTKRRQECKKALGIKGKILKDNSATQEEIKEAEETLSTVHTIANAKSTDGNPVTPEVMTDRTKYTQRVKEFADYYKNTNKYDVLGQRVDALYNLPGSGYTQADAGKFPVFYDPEEFTTSNLAVSSDPSDKSKVTLTWQDNCSFEDSFNIYIDSTSLDTPLLVGTASANSTSATVTLPDTAWQDGCLIWAVPVKNGVDGKIVKPAEIDAAYYVSFYEHENFGGRSVTYCGDYIEIPDFGKTNVGNDRVTSIKICGPYDVQCYEHYYEGQCHSYRFDDTNFSDECVGNDHLSSAIIRRLSQSEYEGVYIFKHHLSGPWIKMESDVSNFKYTRVGNDKASSIRIVGPYECTVYEHSNYGGKKHAYRFTDADMSNEYVGNDRVSSATAQKRLTDDEYNGVYIFDWPYCSGNWDKLTTSIPTMNNTSVGDNTIGSVRVIGSYDYTIWKDPYFSGANYSSSSDLDNANNTPVGDDQTSSVTIVAKGSGNNNKAPVLNRIGPRTVMAGETCEFTINATDEDSSVLSFWAENMPEGATFDAALRTFKWTTRSSQMGKDTVRFVVSDGFLTDYEDVVITIKQKGDVSAFEAIETETYNASSGITVDPDDDDYIIVSNDSFTKYSNVDFEDGADEFYACSKKYNNNSGTVYIEVRLDSLTGPVVGTLSFKPSSRWNERSCKITEVTGVHDLYLRYTGDFYMDYIYFE
jgi:hypothetical protein